LHCHFLQRKQAQEEAARFKRFSLFFSRRAHGARAKQYAMLFYTARHA